MTAESVPTSRDSVDETPDAIRALFDECVRRERDLKTDKIEVVRNNLIRDLSFPRSQFPTPPDISDPDAVELRIWRGDLYRTLTTLLKGAGNDDTFWWWLAVWLRYESIREPEAILPPNVLKRLTEEGVSRLKRFLKTDDYNVLLVRSWLPYTEPLLRKIKWLRTVGQRNPRAELTNAGYDPDALDALLDKRWNSATEATCAWVANRTGLYDVDTLRNSYSRAFAKANFKKMKCFICAKPALNEFWAFGNSVLHCRKHDADKLPDVEGKGWEDRFGYRWWRNNLFIRRRLITT
jgi:hypothetical protein